MCCFFTGLLIPGLLLNGLFFYLVFPYCVVFLWSISLGCFLLSWFLLGFYLLGCSCCVASYLVVSYWVGICLVTSYRDVSYWAVSYGVYLTGFCIVFWLFHTLLVLVGLFRSRLYFTGQFITGLFVFWVGSCWMFMYCDVSYLVVSLGGYLLDRFYLVVSHRIV